MDEPWRPIPNEPIGIDGTDGTKFINDYAMGVEVKGNTRPRQGVKCQMCISMSKKDLRYYDSCPECGKSLYAKKQKTRGKF